MQVMCRTFEPLQRSIRDRHLVHTDVRSDARQKLITAWQNYCENGDDFDPTSPMKQRPMRMSSIDVEDMLPLPDDALNTNLGIDLVVVVTKVCAAVSSKNRGFLYERSIPNARPIT